MRAFTHLCPVFVTFLVLLSLQQTLGSDQTFDLAKIIAEAEVKADLYREARKFNGARRRKATAESRLMQHRSDLILEASKSILEHFPSLEESEVNRMANEGLVAHLEASGNSLNRQFNQITFEDITNFLCNGIGNMACNGVMNSPYRMITGMCNNLDHPLWGATGTRMLRLRRAQYADWFGAPRGQLASTNGQCATGGRNGGECFSNGRRRLPNARQVSHNFHTDTNAPDVRITTMVMQFGQFLDHDMTLTPETEAECCHREGGEESRIFNVQPACLPVSLPCDETHFNQHSSRMVNPIQEAIELSRQEEESEEPQQCNPDALDFVRSIPFCGHSFLNRDQINLVTAYVDASNVYGSTPEVANALRNNNEGQMKTSANNLLPIMNINAPDMGLTAGDIRARDMPGLATMHTIWVREHNRIAMLLRNDHGLSQDEEIYQTARKIVGAEMQSVVYGQWLTAVLGETKMVEQGLNLDLESSYDSQLDAGVFNSFATAAFRFGHTLIQGMIQMHTVPDGGVQSTFMLRDAFFNMSNYFADNGNGMEQILMGLLHQDSQAYDQFVTEDVTNFLKANDSLPRDDLLTRNLQRGREHGLPGYNDFRGRFCDLPISCSWAAPPPGVSSDKWSQLQMMYDNPGDIDLFTGGLAEDPASGAVVGPTFQCLIAEQFRRAKFGDRFFFTHQRNPALNVIHTMSTEQMQNIKDRRLGDILCDTTDFVNSKTNVFLGGELDMSCSDRNELNLNLFFPLPQ